MAVVCALLPSPNQGAHTREDLFSMALRRMALTLPAMHDHFFERPYEPVHEAPSTKGRALAGVFAFPPASEWLSPR